MRVDSGHSTCRSASREFHVQGRTVEPGEHRLHQDGSQTLLQKKSLSFAAPVGIPVFEAQHDEQRNNQRQGSRSSLENTTLCREEHLHHFNKVRCNSEKAQLAVCQVGARHEAYHCVCKESPPQRRQEGTRSSRCQHVLYQRKSFFRQASRNVQKQRDVQEAVEFQHVTHHVDRDFVQNTSHVYGFKQINAEEDSFHPWRFLKISTVPAIIS